MRMVPNLVPYGSTRYAATGSDHQTLIIRLPRFSPASNPIRALGLPWPSQPAASLFDHLIGAGQQRSRDGEAETLGGLEVDDQLKFGRRLYRQVGTFLVAPGG